MPSPGEYFIGRPICLTWPMPLCSLAAGRVEPQPTGAQQRGQPGRPTTSRKTRNRRQFMLAVIYMAGDLFFATLALAGAVYLI